MTSITESEKKLIKATFKNNMPLLVALRKLILPEFDLNADVGDQQDMWMNLKVDDMSPEQAWIAVKARTYTIQHVEGFLMKLKALSEAEDLTPEELAAKAKKDSSK